MRFALLLPIVLATASSLKILGYNPVFGHSHVNYIGKVADVLSEAGHEVVLLTSVINSRLKNKTSMHARSVFFSQTKHGREFEQISDKDMEGQWTASTSNVLGIKEHLEHLENVLANQCGELLTTPGLLEDLRNEKFDVGFSEAMDLCGFAIFHLLRIDKYAITHSFSNYDGSFSFTGMPSFPSYIPGMMSAYGDRMSLFERVINTAGHLFLVYFYNMCQRTFDHKFRDMNLDMPPMKGLLANASFFFTNYEPLIDFPRPSVAKIVEIGGITASEYHPLDEHWSAILSQRERTVYISFGTVVSANVMPDEYKRSIREVVRSFPNVTFIWKYENPEDGIADGVENLLAVRWAPQIDILNDPRLSTFITHGGAGSIIESARAGVPLIVVPVFGDQFRNALQVERMGTSIFVRKEDLVTPDALADALHKIFGQNSFKVRAKEVAQMIADRPFSMKEKLITHFEFLAKHGPFNHLNHYGTELSFIEYYLLDIVAVFAFVILMSVVLFGLLIRFLYRKLSLPKRKLE